MKEFVKLKTWQNFLQSQDSVGQPEPFPISSGFHLISHFIKEFTPDQTGNLTRNLANLAVRGSF
jgi:hypothetical protein